MSVGVGLSSSCCAEAPDPRASTKTDRTRKVLWQGILRGQLKLPLLQKLGFASLGRRPVTALVVAKSQTSLLGPPTNAELYQESEQPSNQQPSMCLAGAENRTATLRE